MIKRGSNKRKFRNIFINKGIQIEYFLVLFLAMFVVGFSIIWDIYVSGKAITQEYAHLYPVVKMINGVLIAKSGVIMLFILFMSVSLSHKIAGPIYRFQEMAKVLGEGDFTSRVNIRRGDNLRETTNTFNDMIEKLRAKIGEYRDFSQRVQDNLGESIKQLEAQKDFASDDVKKNILQVLGGLNNDAGKMKDMFKI